MYPYGFKDKNVQLVVDLYRKWEEPYKNIIHRLQADSRGDVENENSRLERKKLLGLIRDIDFQALKTIVSEISLNGGVRGISHKLKKVDAIRNRTLSSIKHKN